MRRSLLAFILIIAIDVKLNCRLHLELPPPKKGKNLQLK